MSKLVYMKTLDPDVRKALDLAHETAIDFLESLDEMPVAATVDVDTLRSRFSRPLDPEGASPEEIVRQLSRDVDGGLLGSAGGRFFGWVIGGVMPAALATDWLTSTWQQNAALYVCSPAASIVEETVGQWLKEILQLPMRASFALVTGCQMAHVTCLAAARHRLLNLKGWDVETQGLFGAPPIRVISSTERHGSVERALRLLGLGTSHMELLPVNEKGQLSASDLRHKLEERPDSPTLVLLQAGDINIGAYDQFAELIPIARRYSAWVHVDGAFGLWAAASSRFENVVNGMNQADSWATDGHKWLNVPFDCGFAFVADAEAHRASHASDAAYITLASDARDQMNWNPEWSRRARSFAAYAALRQLGRDGITALVNRCCDHAHRIVTEIGNLPGAEVVWTPTINQGLIRFLDGSPKATETDHDRRTDEVIAKILATGEAFFGGTTWRNRRAMRISVCNWRTTDDDVTRVVEAVKKVLSKNS